MNRAASTDNRRVVNEDVPLRVPVRRTSPQMIARRQRRRPGEDGDDPGARPVTPQAATTTTSSSHSSRRKRGQRARMQEEVMESSSDSIDEPPKLRHKTTKAKSKIGSAHARDLRHDQKEVQSLRSQITESSVYHDASLRSEYRAEEKIEQLPGKPSRRAISDSRRPNDPTPTDSQITLLRANGKIQMQRKQEELKQATAYLSNFQQRIVDNPAQVRQQQVLHSTAPHLAIALDNLSSKIWYDAPERSPSRPKAKERANLAVDDSDDEIESNASDNSTDENDTLSSDSLGSSSVRSDLSSTWKDGIRSGEGFHTDKRGRSSSLSNQKRFSWSAHKNNSRYRKQQGSIGPLNASEMLLESLVDGNRTDGERSASDTSNWLSQYCPMDDDICASDDDDDFMRTGSRSLLVERDVSPALVLPESPIKSNAGPQTRTGRRRVPGPPIKTESASASRSVARSVSIESLNLGAYQFPSSVCTTDSLAYSEATSAGARSSVFHTFSASSDNLSSQRIVVSRLPSISGSPATIAEHQATSEAEMDQEKHMGRSEPSTQPEGLSGNDSSSLVPDLSDGQSQTVSLSTREGSNFDDVEDDDTMNSGSSPRAKYFSSFDAIKTPTTVANTPTNSHQSRHQEAFGDIVEVLHDTGASLQLHDSIANPADMSASMHSMTNSFAQCTHHSISDRSDVDDVLRPADQPSLVIDPYELEDSYLHSFDEELDEYGYGGGNMSKGSMPSLASMSTQSSASFKKRQGKEAVSAQANTRNEQSRKRPPKAPSKPKPAVAQPSLGSQHAPMDVVSIASSLTHSQRDPRSSVCESLNGVSGIHTGHPLSSWPASSDVSLFSAPQTGRIRNRRRNEIRETKQAQERQISPKTECRPRVQHESVSKILERLSSGPSSREDIADPVNMMPGPGLISMEQLLYRYARPKKPICRLPFDNKSRTVRASNRTLDKRAKTPERKDTRMTDAERRLCLGLTRDPPESPPLTGSILSYEKGIATLLPVPSPPASVSFASDDIEEKFPSKRKSTVITDNDDDDDSAFMMVPPVVIKSVGGSESVHSAVSIDDTLFSVQSPSKRALAKPGLDASILESGIKTPDLGLNPVRLEIPDTPKIPEASLSEPKTRVISSSSHARLCESPKPTRVPDWERYGRRRSTGMSEEMPQRRARSNSSRRRRRSKKRTSIFSKLSAPFYKSKSRALLPPSLSSTSSCSEELSSGADSLVAHRGNSTTRLGSDHWRDDSVMLEGNKASIWQRIAVEKKRQDCLRARMQAHQTAAYTSQPMTWPSSSTTSSSKDGSSRPDPKPS